MDFSLTRFRQAVLGCGVTLLSCTAYALPALQLGPTAGSTTDWYYNTSSDTWDYIGAATSTANLSAYANATKDNGGNGGFAWDDDGATTRYAYLVIAAVPKTTTGTPFSVTVSGATLFDSGFGTPPPEDENDLSPHSIYDTYFEIYKFAFDGSTTTIGNTEPFGTGGTGTGSGYVEDFAITISSLVTGITGLHFDLFTVKDDGLYTPNFGLDKKLVSANAPYSHDAQWNPGGSVPPTDPDPIPVPGTLLLFGIGLLGLKYGKGRARQA